MKIITWAIGRVKLSISLCSCKQRKGEKMHLFLLPRKSECLYGYKLCDSQETTSLYDLPPYYHLRQENVSLACKDWRGAMVWIAIITWLMKFLCVIIFIYSNSRHSLLHSPSEKRLQDDLPLKWLSCKNNRQRRIRVHMPRSDKERTVEISTRLTQQVIVVFLDRKNRVSQDWKGIWQNSFSQGPNHIIHNLRDSIKLTGCIIL